MMTAVALALIGLGIMLVYAGLTGQSVRDELAAALGGGGKTGTVPAGGGGGGTWRPL